VNESPVVHASIFHDKPLRLLKVEPSKTNKSSQRIRTNMTQIDKRLAKELAAHYDRLMSVSNSASLAIAFIPRTLRDFTDHGQRHSQNIVDHVGLFSKILGQYCGVKLNSRELFLLFASAFLHDIGNIKGRANHAKRSAKIVKAYAGTHIRGLEENEVNLVCDIIKVHSRGNVSSDPLYDLDKLLIIDDDKIRLRLLAALFRLADATDITSRRAPPIIYELFGLDKVTRRSPKRRRIAKNHWLAHQNICGISYDPDEKVVWLRVEVLRKALPAICHFCDELYTVKPVLKNDLPEHFPCLRIRLMWEKRVEKPNRAFLQRFDPATFNCRILTRKPNTQIKRACPLLNV